jgi:hypothetical protein
MRMTLVRTITVSGFTADANPNVTAPAANKLFSVDALSPGDQMVDEGVEGFRFCIRFVDGSNVEIPAASADFRVWQKDDGASDTVGNGGLGRDAYIGLAAEAAAPSSGSYTCTWKGKLFVQVTALNTVGTATKAQIWAEASTSVPG